MVGINPSGFLYHRLLRLRRSYNLKIYPIRSRAITTNLVSMASAILNDQEAAEIYDSDDEFWKKVRFLYIYV